MYNVTQNKKRHIKIEFLDAVHCPFHKEGGELLSECFHKRYPAPAMECLGCLSENAHRHKGLDEFGRELKRFHLRGNQLIPYSDDFEKLSATVE